MVFSRKPYCSPGAYPDVEDQLGRNIFYRPAGTRSGMVYPEFLQETAACINGGLSKKLIAVPSLPRWDEVNLFTRRIRAFSPGTLIVIWMLVSTFAFLVTSWNEIGLRLFMSTASERISSVLIVLFAPQVFLVSGICRPRTWMPASYAFVRTALSGVAFERNHPYAQERRTAREVIRRLNRLPNKTDAVNGQLKAAQAILNEVAPPQLSRKLSPSDHVRVAELVAKDTEARLSQARSQIEAKKEVASSVSQG